MLQKLMAIVFICAFCLPFASSSYADEDDLSALWTNYDVGDKVYAKVVFPPDAIYREIIPNTGPGEWLREENYQVFDEAINVSAHYRFLNPQHVIRVTVQANGFGFIEPDGQYSPYVEDPLSYTPVYVKLRYLQPLDSDAFAEINIYEDTKPVDKVTVVIRDARPRLVLFEGNRPILHVPVVLGPTSPGDYRVYRTRVTDDMPGMPAVPLSNYFSGGYSIHGAPWWNWSQTTHGHYGSHGCVNLPDEEWYQIQIDGQQISVAQWVYRWMSTNLDYDEMNPEVQEARVDSTDPNWYQATGSVRVLVVESIESLNSHPLPARLGELAQNSQITSWQPLIDAYDDLDNQWLIMNQTTGGFSAQQMDSTKSIAQIEGAADGDHWVMLSCEDRSHHDDMAYDGSSRTVGEVCSHLRIERQGSVCTPERIDVAFFGEKTLCNAARFNQLYVGERGDLIEREEIYLTLFSGIYKDLHVDGIAIDDPTPGSTSYAQQSTIGISELYAQYITQGSLYGDYYVFLLNIRDANGNPAPADRRATTIEAWQHLQTECSTNGTSSEQLEALLLRGLSGDAEAYDQLIEQCSLPPHELVPDRWIDFE